jgi:hypothetical protein
LTTGSAGVGAPVGRGWGCRWGSEGGIFSSVGSGDGARDGDGDLRSLSVSSVSVLVYTGIILFCRAASESGPLSSAASSSTLSGYLGGFVTYVAR